MVLLPSSSLLLLLLIITTTTAVTTTTSTSSPLLFDTNALLSLKNSFKSPHPSLSSWSETTATISTVCSTWYGVDCHNGRVTSLDLTDLNLGGTISSPDLSRLDALIHLSLAGNNFITTTNLSSSTQLILPNLQYLNISNNKLTDIFNFATSFPNLQILDANNNNFTSLLPTTNLLPLKHTLIHLDLGGNYFHGQIPSIYSQLTSLEYLFLGGNDLTGPIPSSLGNLTSLQELYLGHYNTYTGGIPSSFSKLTSLRHLDLSNCGLTGQIPSSLGNLVSLTTLFLFENEFTGPIPSTLGNLTNLINLDLSFNSLTGEIPPEFSNLTNLKLLNLFLNNLHGSIPEYISHFTELETLELWSNNFTGTIPTELGRNAKLRVLDLSSNKLTGQIPPHLCTNQQLTILILFKNFLFGPIPNSLGDCVSLTRVRIGQNYLNGSVPSQFIYLPDITLLELQDNYLSGNLTENHNTTTTKLTQINLSNNLLTGPLPPSISNFTSLKILLLSNNRFTDSIPSTIGELTQLTKVDFSGNEFTSEIPDVLSECEHLSYIDLSRNNLSGSIPVSISSLRILNYLNLSRNTLTGTIPESIGSMHSLTNADFSYNNFTGEIIITSGPFASLNASAFIGNPFLCWESGRNTSSPCRGGGDGGDLSSITSSTNSVSEKRKRAAAGQFKLVFALCLLLCSLLFASIAVIKAKSMKDRNTCNKSTTPGTWKMTAFGKVDFTLHDILDCIKDGNVIGRGGAGIVYYIKTPTGRELAVKKLLLTTHNNNNNTERRSSSHADHGFKAEIGTLGNIRHRNIVRLLAYCTNSKPRSGNLLVYEYMRNGSVGEVLHGKKNNNGIDWSLRCKIAVEAAKGLCYLHHDCSPLIVHRDVKSNNILLDGGFEAHVADFGLAKFMVGGGNGSGVTEECMSAIAGSYGYIAPEYAYTLRVDEKSDVYSYGVVLLELLTGKRPVGEFGDGVDIVHWSRHTTNCRREEVNRIIDPRISPTVPIHEAMHMFFIAMLCVQENSVERPTMREVVQMLTELRIQRSDEKEGLTTSSTCDDQNQNQCGDDLEKGADVMNPN